MAFRAGQLSTISRRLLVGSIMGLGMLMAGCAGLTGPNGLGHYVLVVCKLAPDQKLAGQNRANGYFTDVAAGKRARPAGRYVAIQTLNPNKKQEAKYTQAKAAAQKKAESNGQSLGPEWVDPSQLHCVMVFDVVTHESVGTDCYVVAELPKLGEKSTFDTFPAEFVATSTEFVP